MQRRRFLALGATATLMLAGCSRLLRDQAQPEPPASPESAVDGATGNNGPSPGERRGRAVPDEHDDAPAAETGPSLDGETDPDAPGETPAFEDPEVDPELLTSEPSEWGETVTGVRTRLADQTAVALTLDACGGRGGNGYDASLIDTLREYEVPATLFMNARWVEANRHAFADLAADPLFEIANHGTDHRPLSVTGRHAYGISGTASAEAAIEEVLGCQRMLTEQTGTAPRFFRSGTAFYDDVAVRIVRQLGLEVAGYSILGDAGATLSANQVRDALLSTGGGEIVLLHMNHPSSGTGGGMAAAIPTMLERGTSFTTLGAQRLV